jgi:hypothetical protein
MLFSSLREEKTHRVWLCDLGDLCGEKSGIGRPVERRIGHWELVIGHSDRGI